MTGETKLWPTSVYGPVTSRRLGRSLGVNVMPVGRKVCTFDCLYCECGATSSEGLRAADLPSRAQLKDALARRLGELREAGEHLDAITFAGNGEPTLHPVFDAIIDDALALRDQLAPAARLCVLTNGTGLTDQRKAQALTRVDECCVKIDSGAQPIITELDRPRSHYSLSQTAQRLMELRDSFGQRLTVQTMFCQWRDSNGARRSNTDLADVEAWLDLLRKLQPAKLQIYTVSRPPADRSVEPLDQAQLNAIRDRARTVVGEVCVAY